MFQVFFYLLALCNTIKTWHLRYYAVYICKQLTDISEERAASIFKVRAVQGQSTVQSRCHIPQKLHLHQHSCENLKSRTEVCGSYDAVIS